MKVKDDCEVYTDDFHYDLFYGGRIKPEEILENENDIKRVQDAINVLIEFEESCNSQIEGFII